MTTWLTVDEAARHLKMGKSTIYKLAQQDRLPAHKAGRVWRFDVEELDVWLRNGGKFLSSGIHQYKTDLRIETRNS